MAQTAKVSTGVSALHLDSAEHSVLSDHPRMSGRWRLTRRTS